jgi:GNAT superfamily N-acetyltransferase
LLAGFAANGRPSPFASVLCAKNFFRAAPICVTNRAVVGHFPGTWRAQPIQAVSQVDVMSIEVEILNGNHSWPRAEGLFEQVWPAAGVKKLSWGHVKWANPDLRVLIETDDGTLACHVGIYFRTVTWNGQQVHIGGIGGVATHPDHRRRGYASIALTAAAQTMRDHDAAQFALLFCEPHNFDFYRARDWEAFTGTVYAEQPEGRVRFEAMAPFVLDLKWRAPTLGTLDLCGLPW